MQNYPLSPFILQQKHNKKSKNKVSINPGHEVIPHYAEAPFAAVEAVCGEKLSCVKNAKNDKAQEYNQLAFPRRTRLAKRQGKEAYQHTAYLVNHYLRRVAAIKQYSNFAG